VMAFGGSRGIHKIMVYCWTEVEVNKARGRKSRGGKKVKEDMNQFIVTATPGGHDWSAMSRAEVEGVWRVKKDNLRAMIKRR